MLRVEWPRHYYGNQVIVRADEGNSETFAAPARTAERLLINRTGKSFNCQLNPTLKTALGVRRESCVVRLFVRLPVFCFKR